MGLGILRRNTVRGREKKEEKKKKEKRDLGLIIIKLIFCIFTVTQRYSKTGVSCRSRMVRALLC